MTQFGDTTSISHPDEDPMLLLHELVIHGHEVMIRAEPSETGLTVDPHADVIAIDAQDCSSDEFTRGLACAARTLADLHRLPTRFTRLRAV